VAKSKRSQQMSKSTFIRQHPDLSVEELIAKAKAGGTGAGARRGKSVRAAATREVAAVAAPKAARPTRSKETEATFRKLVLDLGLQRSKALLAEVEDKLNALVAGR